MKIIRITFLLSFFFFNNLYILFSQENSIYNNYYLNPSIINPAITGSEYYPIALISIKRQWLGITNSPTTYLLSGNYRIGSYGFYDPKGFVNKSPLKITDRVGLGATIYQDKNGPYENTGGLISYAYHLPINNKSRLSLGMSIVGTNYSFNNSILKPDIPDDTYLYSNNDNVFRANVNFGVYYYSYKYFAGLSSAKILSDVRNVNDNTKFKPSYFLMGGYKFNQKKNFIAFEPSITLKILNSKNISADIFSKLYIKNYNWIAVSYSTTSKMNFMFGVQLRKMLSAGYNFEYSLSKIAKYNYGSHEIYLGFNLGLRGCDFIKIRSNNN